MKNALYELYSLMKDLPPEQVSRFEAWIDRNIEEAAIKIPIDPHESSQNREYELKSAKLTLAEGIVHRQNMFPKFEKTKTGFECRLAVIYFKKEF